MHKHTCKSSKMRSIYFDTNIHTLDNAQDSNDFANKSSCIFQYVVFPPQ